MVLNQTVYQLINVSISWKVFLSLKETNQKTIFPPFGNAFSSLSKNIILKGHPILYPLKKRISMIIILDVSCKVVLLLITSSLIWSGTSHWIATRKDLIVFSQILRTK